jgi:prophage tail gpP-like protein
MSTITSNKVAQFSGVAPGGLRKHLEITGQMPKIEMFVFSREDRVTRKINRFLNYNFSSNMMVPSDSFSFGFVATDGPPLNEQIREGDIVTIKANNVQLFVGHVDQTDVETDANYGEKSQISGRDFVGQLEDQDAVSIDSTFKKADNVSVETAVKFYLENTQLTKVVMKDAPRGSYLISVEPGETKLAVIQRFLDSVNCLLWQDRLGRLCVGRPNMAQQSKGTFIVSRDRRKSNVISIKVTRSSTQIPNIMVPVWSGQEVVADRVPKEQRFHNSAYGPARLLKLGYRLPKCYVTSAPNADSPQGLSEVNTFQVAKGRVLEAYAKRELARANIKEITVQVVVPGHFNELGEPYQPDTMYFIDYDRGSIKRLMYCYAVEFSMDENGGQISTLTFCRPGAIVSDIKAP